jgi:hypothetical protein
MTTEQAKNLSEQALAHLMDALDNGHSEALKTYLKTMSRFHRYSWGNVLLIQSQRPNATRVAGFHGWLKLRRYVRKGERGIVILAPMVGRKKSDDELIEDEKTRLFGFRAAHVFDLSQTDGEALPEFGAVGGDPRNHADCLKQFIAESHIELAYDGGIAPAKGLSSGGRITILPDLSPAEHFAVLAHEVAHELLHRGARRQETTHTMRETEAEAVSFVVCSAIGLETNAASSDYIQLHAGDKAKLVDSLALIQRTATTIIEAIQRETRKEDVAST